jgi:hypothetical protein
LCEYLDMFPQMNFKLKLNLVNLRINSQQQASDS